MTTQGLLTGPPQALSKPSPIRLRLDLVDRLCAGKGARNSSEKGRLFAIDPSLVSRVWRGEVAPGLTFLSRVFATFPEWPWQELCFLDHDNAGLVVDA